MLVWLLLVLVGVCIEEYCVCTMSTQEQTPWKEPKVPCWWTAESRWLWLVWVWSCAFVLMVSCGYVGAGSLSVAAPPVGGNAGVDLGYASRHTPICA